MTLTQISNFLMEMDLKSQQEHINPCTNFGHFEKDYPYLLISKAKPGVNLTPHCPIFQDQISHGVMVVDLLFPDGFIFVGFSLERYRLLSSKIQMQRYKMTYGRPTGMPHTHGIHSCTSIVQKVSPNPGISFKMKIPSKYCSPHCS